MSLQCLLLNVKLLVWLLEMCLPTFPVLRKWNLFGPVITERWILVLLQRPSEFPQFLWEVKIYWIVVGAGKQVMSSAHQFWCRLSLFWSVHWKQPHVSSLLETTIWYKPFILYFLLEGCFHLCYTHIVQFCVSWLSWIIFQFRNCLVITALKP